MKKINLTLILILFFNLLEAQNPLVKQWDYRYGGTGQDLLNTFQKTSDGGYILGGISTSGIGGDKTQPMWDTCTNCVPYFQGDYWIVKIDSLGNKQLDKDFGGDTVDVLCSVQQTADGGFILGGYSHSGMNGDKSQANWDSTLYTTDYWIIKIDSLGNKEWDKDFGGASWDNLYSLQQTADGGYILGGSSSSGINGDKTQNTWGYSDYWIVKIDSLGNKQWDKDFGGTGEEDLYSLEKTLDGGYILGGYSYSPMSGDKTQNTWGSSDYWIVKIDSLGNKQWDKDFGGTSVEKFYSLQKTTDAGYILGGLSGSPISGDKTQNTWGPWGNSDYWIVKIDSLGNKQWDKDFGGTYQEDEFGNVFQTSDGSYFVGGTSYSPMSGDKTENNLGPEQTWLVKTDSLGNKKWDKTIFSTPGDSETGLVVQSNDGCFVIATFTPAGVGGYKTQPSWGGFDFWIIKFCDTTSTTSINQITNSQLPFSIYPNPTNTILNLFVNTKENIIITNLLGEIVLQRNATGKVEFDISFLPSGIYFVRAGNEVRKFVKE